MPIRLIVLALTLALAGQGSLAQADDRPNYSAECRRALDALEAQEAAASAASAPSGGTAQRATQTRLQALQREAAKACLGSTRGGAGTQLPPVVQTPRITVPPVTAMPRPAPPATARVPIPTPLPTITVCDANGCLAGDGTRLQRIGPNLLGPRGLCTVQGALLLCPP